MSSCRALQNIGPQSGITYHVAPVDQPLLQGFIHRVEPRWCRCEFQCESWICWQRIGQRIVGDVATYPDIHSATPFVLEGIDDLSLAKRPDLIIDHLQYSH